MTKTTIMQREEEIRCLAYRIWEEAGYPEGHAMEHWLTAETIWQDEHRESKNGERAKPPEEKRATRRRVTARAD
jgi:hypothetical protein